MTAARALALGLLAAATALASPAGAQTAPKYEVKTTPAPAPPKPQAPKASGEADAKKPPSTTRGATWSDKPRKRRRFRRQRFDPSTPYATFPGFRMLKSGASQLWVRVSKKVTVTVNQAKGRVTYVLTGARVYIRNNTHPLVTTHFSTPVSVARLERAKDGARLVVELRDSVRPTHRVVDGPGGTMLLMIDVPKPTRNLVPRSRTTAAPRTLQGERSRRSRPKIGPSR